MSVWYVNVQHSVKTIHIYLRTTWYIFSLFTTSILTYLDGWANRTSLGPRTNGSWKKNTMQWRSAIGQVSGLTYLELSMIVYNSYCPRFTTGKKDIWIFKNIEKGHNSVTLWTGPHIKSWHVRQYTKGIIISWIHVFY